VSDEQYEYRVAFRPPGESPLFTPWIPMTADELATTDELLLAFADGRQSFSMELEDGTRIYLSKTVLQSGVLKLHRRARPATPTAPRRTFKDRVRKRLGA
jgi:hypothetical protein